MKGVTKKQEEKQDSKVSYDEEVTEDEDTEANGMREELLKRAFDDQNDQKQEN